jgi:glutamate-5-semialdehyde dehydrogenase
MDALLAANVKLLCNEPALSALTSSSTNDSRLNVTTVHDYNVLKANVFPAPSAAYTTQHLSLTLTVRTVRSLAAAIAHINEHGSHESHPIDCIVTESTVASSTFVRGVDSVGVFVNASMPACALRTFFVTVLARRWGSALDGSTLGGLSPLSDSRDS